MTTRCDAGTGKVPTVPQYTILQKLGSGTYATVYKAIKQSGAREVVAIKSVSKKSLTSVSKENLLKEIELLKTLHHPHIVSLVEFVWDASHIHLVLEFCPGGDLLRFIKQRRCLAEAVVRRFLQQLALALHYLHVRNVVHMDLKPQNILLTGTDCPKLKIADFGFAHHLSSERQADQVRGSLLYMAPEIVADRRYSPKCDLWSVGIILYECLFGQAPFASDTYEELYQRILSDASIQVPTSQTLAGKEVPLSASCQDLLARLLQRDPRLRAGHEQFFGHAFLDLQHAPSDACLPRGKQLALRAVAKDSAGQLNEAFVLYKRALGFLVPALHYESNPQKKEQLRDRIYEYMSRAEYLQSEISAGRSSTDTSAAAAATPAAAAAAAADDDADADADAGADSSYISAEQQKRQLREAERWSRIVDLCKGDSNMSKCLHEIRTFYSKISLQQYDEALKLFESTCEKMLALIKQEPEGEKKTLLYELMDSCLSKAESVRKYQQSRDPTKQKRELEAMEKEEAEGWGSCSVM